jgi:predicted HicB family RNase H-like nuclease
MNTERSFKEDFNAEDYSYAVVKEWCTDNIVFNSKKSKGVEQNFKATYKIILFEFEKTIIIESLENIENQALELIKKEMSFSKSIPRPMKASLEFSGKLSLRLDPELHRKLHIKAVLTGESLNKLIESETKD